MDLQDIIRCMNKLGPKPNDSSAKGLGLPSGVPIYKSKYVETKQPVLQLSEKAPVSHAFRASYNAWLKDRFGMKGEDEVFILHTAFGNCAVMHPNTAALMLSTVYVA